MAIPGKGIINNWATRFNPGHNTRVGIPHPGNTSVVCPKNRDVLTGERRTEESTTP